MINPFKKFDELYKEFNKDNKIFISTVGNDNQPTLRIVLLKHYDDNGFIFYTNKNSIKARNLSENQKIAILFDWLYADYQIRIEGITKELDYNQVNNYFATRPRESQINAWASKQSNEINDIEELNKKILFFRDKFKNEITIPCPNYWTGYCVIPHAFEFWKEGEYRCHYREKYYLKNNKWHFAILEP
ncbi:MAG: pyridoxamine 5'-phosphate oxidase [Anaplasmataceae bacterium]|nr:pyridoxamine 5'-phosphate oxidase [Anaplasmataceae bacterium]